MSKYGIGVVSKNTVDACIEYANNTGNTITLIPSRRQIDFNGGYVENWTTKEFAKYVREKTYNIFLKRDHGGPNQGLLSDDGYESFVQDCIYFDALHIDPWKSVTSFENGCKLTKDYIQYCYQRNPHILFEVGTEESIFRYDADKLEYLLKYLKDNLSEPTFNNINFAVIQSGTNLQENRNTGNYDKKRLLSMIQVCVNYKILSKEHNGDYLPVELITEKLKLGLDAINIAPEFGQIETQVYLSEIKNTPLFDIYFDICYASRRWVKWVDPLFNPFSNKEKLINICGHYVLSTPYFLTQIKRNVRQDIDLKIKETIIKRLKELYGRP